MAASTSISHTPQAKDDLYAWSESDLLASGLASGSVLTLDVAANDSGGKDQSLFSIDDGNGNAGATDYDLLNADTAGAWEATSSGNLIRIVNGKIQFDFS